MSYDYSRRGATTPQLERGPTPQPDLERLERESPSAAHQALQGNLDRSTALTSKKSWFGSARGAIVRGALHARGVVDALRPTEKKHGDGADQGSEDRGQALQDEEASVGVPWQPDDADSLTPLKPSAAAKQRTFTPKHAISTLRQNMYSSTRNKHKRPALAEITDLNRKHGPIGPERFSTDDVEEDKPSDCKVDSKTPHERKASVAQSIVGSIRGFGRRSMRSPLASPERGSTNSLLSPTKQAAAIPLPSSPIDSSAPPALKLDLSDAANISTTFIHELPLAGYSDDFQLFGDPVDQVPAKTLPAWIRTPGLGAEGFPTSPNRISRLKPLAASELLRLPADGNGLGDLKSPKTPTPSDGMKTSLDGAMVAKQVFERSVEAKHRFTSQGNRSLKKMASIDALAEQHIADSPRRGIRLTPTAGQKRTMSQATTARSTPSDMPPLTRQLANHSTASFGRQDLSTGGSKSQDPFWTDEAVSNLVRRGPPAPEESARLPFRPKITVQSANGSLPRTFLYDSPIALRETESNDAKEQASRTQEVRKTAQALDGILATINPSDPNDTVFSVSESLRALQDNVDDVVSDEENADSDSYEYIDPEFLLDTNAGELSEGTVADADHGESSASSPIKPFATSLYQRVTKSQTPSPSRNRTGLMKTTDVGDVFWKLKNWTGASKEPETSSPNNIKPSPPQDGMPADDDMASISPWSTTTVSPTTTTPDRDPTMGDRVSLDLKRSDRNMRYNALAQRDVSEDEATSPAQRPCPRPVSSDEAQRLAPQAVLAGLTESNASSSEQKGKVEEYLEEETHHKDSFSSDSIEPDLERAIAENYVFQVAISGIILSGAKFAGASSPDEAATLEAPEDDEVQQSSPITYMQRTGGDEEIQEPQRVGYMPLDSSPSDGRRRDSVVRSERHKGTASEIDSDDSIALNKTEDDAGQEDSLDDCLALFGAFNAAQCDLSSCLSSDTLFSNPRRWTPIHDMPSESAGPNPIEAYDSVPVSAYDPTFRGKMLAPATVDMRARNSPMAREGSVGPDGPDKASQRSTPSRYRSRKARVG